MLIYYLYDWRADAASLPAPCPPGIHPAVASYTPVRLLHDGLFLIPDSPIRQFVSNSNSVSNTRDWRGIRPVLLVHAFIFN